jgi:hypothetical protein
MKIKNKVCTRCKTEYPSTPEYFVRSKCTRDGLLSWCKKCKRNSDKKYHQKNLTKIKKQRAEWRKNNKEITKIRDKKYSEKMKNRRPEDILAPKNKKCPLCKKIKASNEFYKDSVSKCGLTSLCKKCCNAKNHDGYQKHKEKRKEYGRQYNIDNKEEIAKRAKRYYKNNKEQIAEYKRQWQQKNSKQISKRLKRWQRDNKEHVNDYARNRRKNDLNYRILCNLRSRLSTVIKSQGSKKSHRTMELAGCSIDELKNHIQSQFIDGMSWDNYGRKGWHIDHIVPCAMFDLRKPEEQLKCFHYTNLQPLWWPDNCHKNSFYNGKYIRKHRGEKNHG